MLQSKQVIPITVPQVERGIENQYICYIDRITVLCSLILKLLQWQNIFSQRIKTLRNSLKKSLSWKWHCRFRHWCKFTSGKYYACRICKME